MPLRIVFMGTPDFAVPALQALLVGSHQVIAVYTRPPKPKGRGHAVQKSPVHLVAEAASVPVYTPKTLRPPEDQATFAALAPDLAIVAAYGLILPVPVLEATRLGCLNLHASLLPRWRGAAPIQRAILAGDTETGVCLMRMEAGLDTGPVYARGVVPITPTTTAPILQEALARVGADLLTTHLDGIAAGTLAAVSQPDEGVTLAPKLEKAEARLDWSRPAVELDRQIRAFTPWPGATFALAGEDIKVLAAQVCDVTEAHPPGTLLDESFTVACGSGALRLVTVQRPGRGPTDGAACLRGLQHLRPGAALLSP